MTTVTNAPLFSPQCTGVVRAGDPQKYAADPRLVTLEYPYPGSGTYLSVDPNGTISAKPAIDDSCLFQESTPKGFLECERQGPLQFGITYGLF